MTIERPRNEIAQREATHEQAQQQFTEAWLRVACYPPLRPDKAEPRPIATDRHIEELRTLQLAIIAAALRYLAARGLSAGKIAAERARIRAMDTAAYRGYLATAW